MKEYPGDMQSVLTLYAEGYSLADYLVQSGGESGKEQYLRFLQDAHEHDWNHAIRTWYGLPDVMSLERRWSNWVTAGSPELGDSDNERIVQADAQAMRKKGIIVRSQSPDNGPAYVRKTQLSNTMAGANTAGGVNTSDDPAAPAPVARAERSYNRTANAQNDETYEPASDDAVVRRQTAERRREGRERMLRDGWEPTPRPARRPTASRMTSAPVRRFHRRLDSITRPADAFAR